MASKLTNTLSGSSLSQSSSMTSPIITLTSLTADVKMSVVSVQNESLAYAVAFGLYTLMQNTSSLTDSLDELGIDPSALSNAIRFAP